MRMVDIDDFIEDQLSVIDASVVNLLQGWGYTELHEFGRKRNDRALLSGRIRDTLSRGLAGASGAVGWC